MYIRSFGWGRADISWSRVMERLLLAAEQKGHKVSLISTNGYAGMDYWTAERSAKVHQELSAELGDKPFDIDITYTIPTNFDKRLLPNSKIKIGRYDYESSIMRKEYCRWHYPDYIVASSQYVRNIFINNGCPEQKVKIIHSGVDRKIFPAGPSRTGKFKFLCIAEPHQRKQLDRLVKIYFERFRKTDDVVLYLKTKVFSPGQRLQEFEIDIRPVIAELQRKYGESSPEIKLIGGHLDVAEISKLYRACHAFVLPTASEGWGMPFLEAMSSGCLVIAPRHGGQLEFLNDQNSLLADCGVRPAKPNEQYGNQKISSNKWLLNGVVGKPDENHFGDLMRATYENYDSIRDLKQVPMELTSNAFSWAKAADQMLALANVKKADEVNQRA